MFNYAEDPFKLGAMILILALSLFAVSFPAISKQVPIIRIPHVLFFMGKHFGTGVILSTAFCHLLQDSFVSLQDHNVKEYSPKISKWTGLIILSSLLAIFLVEYISTTYVDYLHTQPSITHRSHETGKISSRSTSQSGRRTPSTPAHPTISDSLLLAPQSTPHPGPHNHPHHPHHTKRAPASLPVELITNSRLRVRCCLSDDCSCHLQTEQGTICQDEPRRRDTPKPEPAQRQLIGILVLQLGIMIHSLVIGLTLSITRGSDFASLLIAICFHQVFEGLSLGIRIDALTPQSLSLLSSPKSPSPLSISSESTPLLSSLPALHWSPARPRPPSTTGTKTILSILFAITTPFGMFLGLTVFPHSGSTRSADEKAFILLTQGVMSAISAGLLIYAATVEMLAGDFVFGDVSGGHLHHSSAHTHGAPSNLRGGTSGLGHRDPEEGQDDGSAQELHHPEGHKNSTIGEKALAVVSLLAGVIVMNITAIFE